MNLSEHAKRDNFGDAKQSIGMDTIRLKIGDRVQVFDWYRFCVHQVYGTIVSFSEHNEGVLVDIDSSARPLLAEKKDKEFWVGPNQLFKAGDEIQQRFQAVTFETTVDSLKPGFVHDLGSRAKSVISGIEGIITDRSENLFSCHRYFIQPKAGKDMKVPDGLWCDEMGVVVLDHSVVSPSGQEAGGPESKIK